MSTAGACAEPCRGMIAVRQPVVAQDIAVVPEVLHELSGLLRHVRFERVFRDNDRRSEIFAGL